MFCSILLDVTPDVEKVTLSHWWWFAGSSWLLENPLSWHAYCPRWIWWGNSLPRDQNTNYWSIQAWTLPWSSGLIFIPYWYLFLVITNPCMFLTSKTLRFSGYRWKLDFPIPIEIWPHLLLNWTWSPDLNYLLSNSWIFYVTFLKQNHALFSV